MPEEARRCVAFVGFRNRDGIREVGGTAFFVVRWDENLKRSFPYVITSRHVINEIRDIPADRVYLRLNVKDGSAQWMETSIADWHFHPDESEVDVALLRRGFPVGSDHVYLPTNVFVTEDKLAMYEIGNGDDVVITGLFRNHQGRKKNIPIVRLGNIAAMPEEEVEVPGWGMIDAYLVEARSTGAISGSPVFIDLGLHRIIQGQLMQTSQGPTFYLLGLMHGHWESSSAEKVNMGIAIVVPASKIIEVIRQPLIRRLDDEEAKRS
ncbi:MAG: hypothetical protein ACXW3C_04025 [Pyrinomonadaceae bacterium]